MKKRLHLLCLLCAVWVLGLQNANAQGCVAIRSMGCGGSNPMTQSNLFGKGEWRNPIKLSLLLKVKTTSKKTVINHSPLNKPGIVR